MRYINVKLDDTAIQMEPTVIRQYNNLVDTVVINIKKDIDGLDVQDFNAFIQTDNARRDKIPLASCTSSPNVVIYEGYLGFLWPIDAASTRYHGKLLFEVQLEHKTDAAIPIWQSEVCELITVAPNICDNTALGDDGPAILQEVTQKLAQIDDQVDRAEGAAQTAAQDVNASLEGLVTEAESARDDALAYKTAAAASANTTTSDRAAAAASAAAALASAQAAAAAVDLQIIDDTTGTHYQFGANNGLIYLEVTS